MPTERTYGGYTLEQAMSRIRELEADLARLTAERDERWPAVTLLRGSAAMLTLTSNGVYVAEYFPDANDPWDQHMETAPTPAAALQALKDKIGGGR